jgi:hypothetical protein
MSKKDDVTTVSRRSKIQQLCQLRCENRYETKPDNVNRIEGFYS